MQSYPGKPCLAGSTDRRGLNHRTALIQALGPAAQVALKKSASTKLWCCCCHHPPRVQLAHDTKRLPTLTLRGNEDRVFLPEHGRVFHQDIAGNPLQVFESLHHVPYKEGHDATVQTVKQF